MRFLEGFNFRGVQRFFFFFFFAAFSCFLVGLVGFVWMLGLKSGSRRPFYCIRRVLVVLVPLL